MLAPYTIYCDCEAIIKNIDDKDIHQISGFNISVVSEYEETQSITYIGDKAGEVFWSKMEKFQVQLYKKILNANAKMVYSDEDKKNFKVPKSVISVRKTFLLTQKKLTLKRKLLRKNVNSDESQL